MRRPARTCARISHSIRGRLDWRSRIHLLTQIDRSQQSAAMQQGSDPHTARVRSVSESTGACMRPHSAGDCKRESSPRAAPQLGKMHPRMGRRGPSRVRPGQVADAMRVRAGVAPRVASGDRAASKGKPAGGCSSFKRRVEQEHRCAAPHARSDRPWCVCACAQVGWAPFLGWKVG